MKILAVGVNRNNHSRSNRSINYTSSSLANLPLDKFTPSFKGCMLKSSHLHQYDTKLKNLTSNQLTEIAETVHKVADSVLKSATNYKNHAFFKSTKIENENYEVLKYWVVQVRMRIKKLESELEATTGNSIENRARRDEIRQELKRLDEIGDTGVLIYKDAGLDSLL